MSMSILDKFKQVTTFVFDVDGVLTDGTLFVFDDGQFVRRMNIKDGFALQLAVKKGYRVVIISGGASEAVTQRLNRLGINDVFMQVSIDGGKTWKNAGEDKKHVDNHVLWIDPTKFHHRQELKSNHNLIVLTFLDAFS